MIRLALLLGSLLALPALAAERPRLGVYLIVDQLSAESFRARLPLAKHGLKRLVEEGYAFHEARFEAAPTITSTGHATLVTGAYAEVHGIVANEWLEGDTGTPRLSTEDASFTVLGRPPHPRDGTAPTWLRAPTLADTVRGAHDAAKAVSVSGKDRSAILCAGRAGLAVWFDAERPFFTTSTFYASELPAFVTPVNERLAAAVVKGAFAWGLPAGGVTGTAPHLPSRAGDSEPLAEEPSIQPAIDAAEVDVALEAVKALGLGADEVPDLLTVSFSGHDRIGHQFGPDSPEGLAEFLAVDREVGRLLTELDRLVGRGRYVVALSSDHGVTPLPETSKARGLDAGRVEVKALRERLDQALDAALGPQDWFAGYKTPGYTFKPALRAKALGAVERLRAVARQFPGVLDLLPSHELDRSDATAKLYRRHLTPGRSPDLILVVKPYWTYGTGDKTGHASPWLYDRAVPLVFWGPGVKPGQGGTAEVIDAAPTLSRLLHVPTPAAATGRALDEVFR